MTDKQLIRIVRSFRKGILSPSGKVKGACYKVSLPLQTFLTGMKIECELVEVGIVVNSLINQHYFIKLSDGRILDATASQFNTPDGGKMPDIYLGERPAWYLKIRNGRYSEEKRKIIPHGRNNI